MTPQGIQTTLTGSAYTSSATTVFLGLNVDEWGIAAMAVGIVVTILTYLTGLYFRIKNRKPTTRR